MSLQPGWRWCHKCEGLFLSEVPGGRCPAGGIHSSRWSSGYVLEHDNPEPEGEPGWLLCGRCGGLFHGGYSPGRCAAGGTHMPVEGRDYIVPRRGAGQKKWRWCRKCEGLFHIGSSLGRCPAGGAHMTEGSRKYRVAIDPESLSDFPPQEHAADFMKDGSWFRDPLGRYTLLRGVNFGSRTKLPPYLPTYPIDPYNPLGVRTFDIDRFRADLIGAGPDLDRLASLGFNVVRLLVMWKALEPVPNPNLEQLLPAGEEYLRLVAEVVEELYARGIFVVIDFHQDIAHEVFGGDGFPDWALALDETHPRPVPSALRDTDWGLHLYDTPLSNNLVRHTLRTFWRNSLRNVEFGLNDFPVQTHLVKTIGQTARFFRRLYQGNGHPGILGYEVLNEPHPVGLGKREFETRYLAAFYRDAVAEIRRFDDRAFIFLEPRMDWTAYSADGDPMVEFKRTNFTLEPETFLDLSAIADERLVFAFHHYDPWTLTRAHTPSPFFPFWSHGDDMVKKENDWPGVFRRMVEAATSRGMIPFLSEFGGDQGWRFDTPLRPAIYKRQQVRAYMDLQFQQVERYLLNATYWNYDLYNSEYGRDNWNLEDFSLLGPGRTPRNIDIVARPYPMRSSARPTLLRFDLESRICIIVLEGEVVPAPAVIYVPEAIHYPQGFQVRASGAPPEWDAMRSLLFWGPDPARPRNVMVIAPPDMPLDTAVPADLRELMEGTAETVFR